MSNNIPQPADHLPEWYDPFPEPQTMPNGWDLSEYGYTQHDAPTSKEVHPVVQANP